MIHALPTHAKDQLSGEERLWYGTLGQALKEAIGPDSRLRAQAFEWIERHEDQPGGFDWCCHGLGLTAQRLRENVRQKHYEANRTWGECGPASSDQLAVPMKSGHKNDRTVVSPLAGG